VFLLLGLTFAVGAVVGRARKLRAPAGGSPVVPPLVPWVLGTAAVLQVALRVLPADLRSQVGSVVVTTSALLAASALAMVAYYSPHLRVAAALALAGGGLNAAVMLANGGMPVSASAAEHLNGDLSLGDEDTTARHVVLDERTRLTFLADVVPVRFGSKRGVVSAGDLVLLGAAAAAAHNLTRRSFPPGSQDATAGSRPASASASAQVDAL
jgi:hypothetical protein